ncbi:hypothetical protein [Dongshaea marina]|uniref:hypothetical protein n=1 Tax=Dongshaea marina TaxID=2047966 RepID=UPI000D3EAE21|nr:hypothetical protein [Dongshaea marina]
MPSLEQTIHQWLAQITEQADSDIIAFNFGMFQSPQGYQLYLMGSASYDPTDDNWACDEDYTPENGCLSLESFSFANETSALEEVAGVLLNYIQGPQFEGSVLANAEAITIGFDDSELLQLLG